MIANSCWITWHYAPVGSIFHITSYLVQKQLFINFTFFQIDVTQEELIRERDRIISDLIYPLNTVLDESLGCALWFASRGKGYLVQPGSPHIHYNSPARVNMKRIFEGCLSDTHSRIVLCKGIQVMKNSCHWQWGRYSILRFSQKCD